MCSVDTFELSPRAIPFLRGAFGEAVLAPVRDWGMTREQVLNEVLLAKQPTRKFVQPEEVAALAVFLCRDEAQNINGANYSIDGGWTAG